MLEKNKKIYRIEHSSLLGLWRARDSEDIPILRNHSKYEEISDRHENMPTCYEDLELNSHDINLKCYYFGYNSLNDLKDYIKSSEYDELYELGFKVYEIKVSKCYSSSYQTVFTPSNILTKKEITKKEIW